MSPSADDYVVVLNWLCRYAPAARLLLDGDGRLTGSLLDVGCGPHGFACVAPGVPFVGLDVTFPGPVDPSMVALRVSPGRLPFADATFGTVLCLDVLEHVPPADRAPFVRELSRVAAERVVLACPSSEAAHVDDWVRRLFGGATPEWLVEHDALGLPTPDEIAECAHGCDGFRAVPLAMPNSLVSALTVVADFLTPFTAQAAQEAAERPAEWVRLFEAARFGSSWRKGWIIEREQAVAPLVGPDADGLEAATLAAVRCPDCGGAFERVEPRLIRCVACERLAPRDPHDAWHVDAPRFDGLATSRPVRLLCEPSWEPASLARLLHAFVDRGDPDAVLVLRAAPEQLSGENALGRAQAALGARPLGEAEVLIVTEPLTRAELEQLRAQTVLVGEDDPLPARA